MTSRSRRFSLVLALHIQCIGCATEDGAAKASVATGSTADSGVRRAEKTSDPAASETAARERDAGVQTAADDDDDPSFTNVYDSVLRKFCYQPFCHGGGSVGFDTRSRDAAYQSLVGVPANPMRECADSGLVRVVPGEPQQSLLFRKLSLVDVPCGQQMPVGGELKPELKLLIERWIAAGAQNN